MQKSLAKAYIRFCFDNEDSSEDDIDYHILAELIVLKALQYRLQVLYRQWDSNWERMLEDDSYMSDDEFLSNFHMDRLCIMQLNSLLKMMNSSGVFMERLAGNHQCFIS